MGSRQLIMALGAGGVGGAIATLVLHKWQNQPMSEAVNDRLTTVEKTQIIQAETLLTKSKADQLRCENDKLRDSLKNDCPHTPPAAHPLPNDAAKSPGSDALLSLVIFSVFFILSQSPKP